MRHKFSEGIATFFYVGFLPKAPGSIASLVAAFLCILLTHNPGLYVFTFIVITLAGFWASGTLERLRKDKDPSCVVIDEVAGVFIAYFLLPVTLSVFITAFFVFRAFDMFKIYPSNQFEKIKGSVGIMSDDLTAGVYTNVVMHTALWIKNACL